MNEKSLQLWHYAGKIVRTMTDEWGKLWFVAKDVLEVLGYGAGNTTKIINDHCKPKGIIIRKTLTSGGNQELTYINERNVVRLIMRSKLPGAELFQEWIEETVIPEILKTGEYSNKPMIPDFTDPVLAARAWADEFEKRRVSEAIVKDQQKVIEVTSTRLAEVTKENEENAPKVAICDEFLSFNNPIPLKNLANALDRCLPPGVQTIYAEGIGIPIGRTILFRILHHHKFLFPDNSPYQNHREHFETIIKDLPMGKSGKIKRVTISQATVAGIIAIRDLLVSLGCPLRIPKKVKLRGRLELASETNDKTYQQLLSL